MVRFVAAAIGRSIPFGPDWDHAVEEALAECDVMFVFLSPGSRDSAWLEFEAGFAYSKGIRVVPVGMGGVDIAAVGPPLGLLQGFNLVDEVGLGNLISIANEKSSVQIDTTFTASDYRSVFMGSMTFPFGDNAEFVKSISFHGRADAEIGLPAIVEKQLIQDHLPFSVEEDIGSHFVTTAIDSDGFSFRFTRMEHQDLYSIEIDPAFWGEGLGRVREVFANMGEDITGKPELRVDLTSCVVGIRERYRMLPRLKQYGALLVEDGYFQSEDGVQFRIDHETSYDSEGHWYEGAPVVYFRLSIDDPKMEQVSEIVGVLVDSGILQSVG